MIEQQEIKPEERALPPAVTWTPGADPDMGVLEWFKDVLADVWRRLPWSVTEVLASTDKSQFVLYCQPLLPGVGTTGGFNSIHGDEHQGIFLNVWEWCSHLPSHRTQAAHAAAHELTHCYWREIADLAMIGSDVKYHGFGPAPHLGFHPGCFDTWRDTGKEAGPDMSQERLCEATLIAWGFIGELLDHWGHDNLQLLRSSDLETQHKYLAPTIMALYQGLKKQDKEVMK